MFPSLQSPRNFIMGNNVSSFTRALKVQLMSMTMPVHVRYKSLYISLPFSAIKKQRQMTKFCVIWRSWATKTNLFLIYATKRKWGGSWSLEATYQTRKKMFDHISKHREENWKYDALRSILTIFEVFENVIEHCLECLIYLLNQTKAKEKTEK